MLGCIAMLVTSVPVYAEDMGESSSDSISQGDAYNTGNSGNIGDAGDSADTCDSGDASDIGDTGDSTDTGRSREEAKDWSADGRFAFEYIGLTPLEEEGNYELKVDFTFRNPESEELELMAGDKAILKIPAEWFRIEDTKEGEKYPVYYGANEEERVLTDQMLAEYTVSGQTVEILFHENGETLEDITAVFGELNLTVRIPENVLKETEQEVIWDMQTYEDGAVNQAKVLLPAMVSEEADTETFADVPEGDAPQVLNDAPQDVSEGAVLGTNRNYTSAVIQDIYWQDNNDTSIRKSPDAYKEQFYKEGFLQFSYKMKDGTVVTEQVAVKDVLSSEQLIISDVGGTGHYIMGIPVNCLPGSCTYMDEENNGQVANITSWTFLPPSEIDVENYYFLDVPDEATRARYSNSEVGLGWYYLKEFEYTLDVTLRRGDKHPINGITEAVLNNFTFNYRRNGADENFQSVLLENLGPDGVDVIKFEVIEYGDSGDPDEINVFRLSIDGIPQYRIDGTEREYFIEQITGDGVTPGQVKPVPDEGEADTLGDDYLTIDYVNTAASNHGSVTDRGYPGGNLILTLTGETEYEGTKVWQDQENNTNRPSVQYTLWRYSRREGTDYTTAAQVKNADGHFLQLTADAGYRK